jgi:hypothetical protein
MNMRLMSITAAVAALSSCAALGGGRSLSRGPDMPAAVGEVSFTRMGAGGTAVDLRVKHLNPPERLNPPGYTYVAWVRARRDEAPTNLGFLNMAPDLSGELRALAPVECSELFITAEATGDAERPTGRRLLWAACE